MVEKTQNKYGFGHKMKFTLEMMADLSFMEGHLRKEMEHTFMKHDSKMELWYYTFLGDDWRNNMATLEAYGSYHAGFRNELLVTALEDDLEKAIQWVRDHNPHLKFLEEVRRGYNADDFVHLRKSVILKHELIGKS